MQENSLPKKYQSKLHTAKESVRLIRFGQRVFKRS